MKKSFFLYIVIAIFPFQLFSIETPQETFEKRRTKLSERVGENSIAIFIAPKVSNRNSDIDYKYRANSDIYYLTGYEEPEFAFVIAPGAKHEFVMFVKENTDQSKLWEGEVPGIKGAIEQFGADTAYSIEQFHDKLPTLLRNKEKLFYDLNSEELNSELLPLLDKWYAPKKLEDPTEILKQMRTIKDSKEIELIQESVNITCQAMQEAAKEIKPGVSENNIMATIEYNFRIAESERNAFPCIVASGKNSLVLHYNKNNCIMNDGDLVSIDIGAEYNYYASDITRTFPVNGKFTDQQKTIYNIVLHSLEEIYTVVKPGASYMSINNVFLETLNNELLKIGLLTDLSKEWQKYVWYAHGIFHPLGIDPHDVFYYNPSEPFVLKEGVVLAIEPGVYISMNSLNSLKAKFEMYGMNVSEEELNEFIKQIKPKVEKYNGIGVRIEDDVLVTKDGVKVLSEYLPKTANGIEKLMK